MATPTVSNLTQEMRDGNRMAAHTRVPDVVESALVATCFQEWMECRTTIGRMDAILADVRKFGFTFITTLLTASALFGFSSPDHLVVNAVTVAFVAVLALITLLYFVDVYYTTLLSGAVERALDLEEWSKERLRLTKYLSDNAHKIGAVPVALALYLALNALTTGLAVWFEWTQYTWRAVGPWLVLGIGAVLLVLMAVYWWIISGRVHPVRLKPTRRWLDDVTKSASYQPNASNKNLDAPSVIGRSYKATGEWIQNT